MSLVLQLLLASLYWKLHKAKTSKMFASCNLRKESNRFLLHVKV